MEREARLGPARRDHGVRRHLFGRVGRPHQVLTVNLAAHYRSPLSVGVGAVVALWAVAALAVTGGQNLVRFVDIKTLRIITAAVLTVLAGLAAWQAVR